MPATRRHGAMSISSPPTSATRTRSAPTRAPAASSSPGVKQGGAVHLYRGALADPFGTDVKQQLAAARMLFDWLITGQVVPVNPAAAVRGPKHVVKTGKTPVLEGKEWRKLIDAI